MPNHFFSYIILGTMHTLLTVSLKTINNIIQPNYCITCYRRIPSECQSPLCKECITKIEFNLAPFCLTCGRSLHDLPSVKGICKQCLLEEKPQVIIYHVFKYRQTIREAIHRFKYQAQLGLLPFFTNHLFNFYREYILPYYKIDYISYVPLYAGKLREREFNQAEILATALACKIETPVLNLLIRTKYTRPQSELDENQRWKNVAEAFKLNPRYAQIINGKTILIIDDVVTTRATLTACARQLKEFNVQAIGLALAGG